MHISREKQIHRKTETWRSAAFDLCGRKDQTPPVYHGLLMVLLKTASSHTAILLEKPSGQEMNWVYWFNLEAWFFSSTASHHSSLCAPAWAPHGDVRMQSPSRKFHSRAGTSRPMNCFTLTGWGTIHSTALTRGICERKLQSWALVSLLPLSLYKNNFYHIF